MRVEMSPNRNLCCIYPERQIIGDYAIEFQRDLATFLNNAQVKHLIIDFQHIKSLDSWGVGALVQAHVTCQRRQAQLFVCGLNGTVSQLLQSQSLDKVLKLYPSQSEIWNELQEHTPENSTEKERRRYVRYKIHLPLLIRTQEQKHTSVIKNLSLGGLALETTLPLQRDDLLHFQFLLGRQYLTCSGRVVIGSFKPQVSSMYGIEFISLPANQALRLTTEIDLISEVSATWLGHS